MRAAFLAFSERGQVMTKEEVAEILKVKPEWVRRNSQPPHGKIPRIPHLRHLRFDPTKMIEVFCEPSTAKEEPRSLTIERRQTSGTKRGGFAKCL